MFARKNLEVIALPVKTKPRQEKEVVFVRQRKKKQFRPARFKEEEETEGKDKHVRTLAHGEIIERTRLALDVLFTETIPPGERNIPYGLKNVRDMIRPDVQPWVRRYSTDKKFQLTPVRVQRALLTMRKNYGLYFRVEDDAVLLLRKNEQLTVHHELRRR